MRLGSRSGYYRGFIYIWPLVVFVVNRLPKAKAFDGIVFFAVVGSTSGVALLMVLTVKG